MEAVYIYEGSGHGSFSAQRNLLSPTAVPRPHAQKGLFILNSGKSFVKKLPNHLYQS
jgi:hypothetical protein